jgi:hypothetical protein
MIPIVIAGALILAVITVAFVLYPVFRASTLGRRYITDSAAGDRLAELIARREAIYEAIRDADFDRETGKLTEEDHRLMRERLTAEGVRLLQELDLHMQSDERENLEDEIEREVATLRRARLAETVEDEVTHDEAPEPARLPAAVGSDGRFVSCHSCGGRLRASARFCTHCGVSLALTCPKCGTSVEADDQFCGHCGAHLATTGEVTEAAQTD